MSRKKFLIGQLANFGDCVLATVLARQIKMDYPGCHLTWAIGSMCRPVLIGNPFVDEIWEIPVRNAGEVVLAWMRFEKEALSMKARGEFDEIYLTQIFPNNYQNFDGTIRYSIFRGYPNPITVPVSPVIRLTDTEVEKVRKFAQAHELSENKNVILFECVARSGQSFVTHKFVLETAQLFIQRVPDVCIILSSHMPIISSDKRIIDGSVLSIRENAELTKYCSLLVGCASGISWLCTCDWAKPLPMVQLLKKGTSVFASFVHDYEYRKASTNLILEMTDCPAEHLAVCLEAILKEGFAAARSKYHENIPLNFDFYCWSLGALILKGKFSQVIGSLRVTTRRYGLRMQLIKSILRQIVVSPFQLIYSLLQKTLIYLMF